MCLAVPGKITGIKGNVATVDYGAEKRKGKIIEKNYNKGDYVIVQGGIVIQRIGKKEAEEALRVYNQSIQD